MTAASEEHCFRHGKVRIRLVVGVTGHRTLDAEGPIAERVVEILAFRLREAFDERTEKMLAEIAGTPVPLTIVTPLAEGADQLVASVALKFPHNKVEAIIPFAEEDYLSTFEQPASRERFAELKGKAHRWTVLDVEHAPGNDEVRRQIGYQKAGEYVLEKSDVLVAIWNGKPARGKGGTAEVIAKARRRGIPLFIISSEAPHAITVQNYGGPRLNPLQELEKVLFATLPQGLLMLFIEHRYKRLYGGAGLTPYGRVLEEIEAFNAAAVGQERIEQRIDEEYGKLYDGAAADTIPGSLREIVHDRLLPVYARASILAEQYQARYRHIGKGAYSLATVSVALLAVGVVWEKALWVSPAAFGCELVLLLLLLYILHRREKKQVQKKWLENRALAERLRVALFFVSCGLQPRTSSRPYRGETVYTLEEITEGIGAGEWVSRSYDAVVYSLPSLPDTSTAPQAPFVDYLRDTWIDGQKEYHRRKSDAAFRSNEGLKAVSKLTVICAVVASAVHLAGYFTRYHESFIFQLLSVIAIILPVMGAAFAGYRTLMEYPRISSSSRVMYGDLQKLAQDMKDVSAQEQLKQEHLRRLLLDTEAMMLRESQNWVTVMRFAELEPP